MLHQLVVRAPRAGRTALFRGLDGDSALPLTDRQTADMLGRPAERNGSFVRRFLALTIKAQRRERELGEASDPPLWLPSDEESLIQLQHIAASQQASILRPYLVKVRTRVAPLRAEGYFQVQYCDGDLLVETLGVEGLQTRELPLVVFLPTAPTRVETLR